MPPSTAEQTPPLVLVVGPEELLVDRAVAAIVADVRAADPDADIRDLTAAGLEPGTVTGLASPSLFGDRTVIVVRGVQDAGEELAAELKTSIDRPAPDVTLVLTHTKGTRGSGVLRAARAAGAREVVCPEIKTGRDRLAFLGREFANARRRASAQALDVLIEAVGSDPRELAGAVSQLCADTAGTIDGDVVRRYYAGHAQVSGFTVADRAVEGRAGEALAHLRYAVASGTEPVLITAALAAAVRTLGRYLSAGRGMPDAELAREIGVPPWKLRIVRNQARGWDGDGVARALTAVAAADAAVKGAEADPLYPLERVVVTIARARRAR